MAGRLPSFYSAGAPAVGRGRGRGRNIHERRFRSISSPADPTALSQKQKPPQEPRRGGRTQSSRPTLPPVPSTGVGYECFELYTLASKEGISSALQLLEEELMEIVCLWWNLGLKLGVPKEQLDTIERDYFQRGGIERCRIEMLDNWLNRERYPRWIDIIKALDKIGSRFMAAKLAEKYAVDLSSPLFRDSKDLHGDAQYEELIAEFRKIDKRVADVQQKFDQLSKKMSTLLDRMEKLENKSDFIEKRLDTLKTDLVYFKEVSDKTNDKNEVTLIDITCAENAKEKIETTTKKLNSLDKEQSEIRNNMQKIKVNVKELEVERCSLEEEKRSIMVAWEEEATHIEKEVKKLTEIEQNFDNSIDSRHGLSPFLSMYSVH